MHFSNVFIEGGLESLDNHEPVKIVRIVKAVGKMKASLKVHENELIVGIYWRAHH